MRRHARLVIIGAGIVGCSAAYHLAKLGWRDIVVLDQGPLYATGGSTSHAPGLVFQTNSSKMMTEFAKYTVKLLSEQASQGHDTWYGVGGVEVAYSPERWQELKRKQGFARAYNLESHLISAQEARDLVPLLDPAVIKGAYYVPTDGDAKAVNAAAALAHYAIDVGAAEFYGETPVSDIEVEHGRVQGVMTDSGLLRCEQILLCTNIWAPVLAQKLGVHIPLLAVEHLYAITTPVPELAGEKRFIVHPILRHQDHALYYRQHGDRYGIGSYQHQPLLVDPHEVGKVAMRPFTPEHFQASWASTTELLPALAATEVDTRFNGMFAFTVDGYPVMGPAPHIAGMWVATGVWVTHSAGVGKAIAEWMTAGTTETDVREADISRFHPHVFTPKYIAVRCATQYDEVYDIIHPKQQLENPRNLRISPFHSRLQDLGAVFFESAGWERPQWFETNAAILDRYTAHIPRRGGWEAMHWSPIEGAEHLATREGVGLFDLTAFTKIDVRGPGSTPFLEYLTANRIDRPTGKITYTALLNNQGGIKADLTVTRWAEDHYWVLTGGGTGMMDLAWLRQHRGTYDSVQIEDITSSYATVGLWGPRARDLLSSVSTDDLSSAAFPYFSARPITIDAVPCLALRLSYAGELGWEIYTRSEYGLRLWDSLWHAGQKYGIIAAGFGAFDSLRLEKGYRSWGADIHTEYTPYEAGLEWAVHMKGKDFLGRSALMKVHAEGIHRQLCCMTLADKNAVLLGKEPITRGDETIGYVTSANYGYSIGQFIAYGYLPIEHSTPGTEVQIWYFGQPFQATVREDPLFDPDMERLRA